MGMLSANSRLALSRRMAIESDRGGRVIVFDTETSARAEISRPVYNLLKSFSETRRVGDVLPAGLSPSVTACLQRLISLGFLSDADGGPNGFRREKRLSPAPYTLFRVPQRSPDQPAGDIAVVGVPCDFGSVAPPGARFGPRDIRLKSWDQEYRVDFLTQRPLGWFDVDNEERVLAGVTINDWGDVRLTYGETLDQICERIAGVCRELEESGAFPVFLGGDHSLSYPVIHTLAESGPIGVIWVDAHMDYGELTPGLCHNQKNVVRRLLRVPNVVDIVNLGHRGYTTSDKVNNRPEKLKVRTAARIRNEGAESVLDLLSESLPYYLSIDIDVLDPIYASGTSTPSPGGFSPDLLKQLLRTIGRHRRIIGLDLTEVNPSRDATSQTCVHAYQALTAALGAVFNASNRAAEQNKAAERRAAVTADREALSEARP